MPTIPVRSSRSAAARRSHRSNSRARDRRSIRFPSPPLPPCVAHCPTRVRPSRHCCTCCSRRSHGASALDRLAAQYHRRAGEMIPRKHGGGRTIVLAHEQREILGVGLQTGVGARAAESARKNGLGVERHLGRGWSVSGARYRSAPSARYSTAPTAVHNVCIWIPHS